MSNQVFPTDSLKGITFSSFKTATWARRVQRSVSGRELVVQDYANPIWNFRLQFSFLRDYPVGLVASEMKLLMDFVNQMQAFGDTFLYKDRDDYSVANGALGVGDGTKTTFQLLRAMTEFGFYEDITAPLGVSNVYVDGVDPGGWTLDADTGVITMASAPANGAVVTADFQFYFRVRLADDGVEFERFMHQLWAVKELRFRSVVL
jgi:uncharacterized protein (TIGR02217 family)